YQKVDIDIYKNKPYISAIAKLGSLEIILRMLLDTGAALPLLLYTNTHEDLTLPETTITGHLGMGLGGFLEGYIGRIDHFQFGEFEYNSLIASFQELNIDSLLDLNLNKNGIIGNSMLKRFNYYIDYNHEILYIKANRKYRKRFQYDKSGLVIAAAGYNLRNYVIQRVIPGSPAQEAGLIEGDVIKKIQRIPATFYTLSGINSILSSRRGKKVHLTIHRDGQRVKKKLKLRDLI
ncbi:MAG: aspartyl protease family protein, partial [Saprospiraceae bacterium]|nr:aspartyl protease family protein [Saprospiraceae bacterium]